MCGVEVLEKIHWYYCLLLIDFLPFTGKHSILIMDVCVFEVCVEFWGSTSQENYWLGLKKNTKERMSLYTISRKHKSLKFCVAIL